MGAFTTWPSWPASGSAAGGAAGAAGAGRASAGAGAVPRPSVAADAGAMLTAPPLTIFTFSSPSVISSSAMPDSCTRSISFFSLRRSIGSSWGGRSALGQLALDVALVTNHLGSGRSPDGDQAAIDGRELFASVDPRLTGAE